MSKSDGRDFAPPDSPQQTGAEDGEYVFRFRVGSSEAAEAAHDDPLVELVRGQLADLLEAVIVTDRGRRLRIDGFRFLHDPATQYEIFPKRGGDSQG